MKRIKINLDRPQLDSKSIQTQKDFNSLMNNHAIMSKPFYKSTWFMGTAGLASVGIVIGSVVAFQDPPDAVPDLSLTQNEQSVPPDLEIESNSIIALNSGSFNNKPTNNLVKETLSFIDLTQNKLHDKTSTLDNNSNNKVIHPESKENLKVDKVIVDNSDFSDKNISTQNNAYYDSDLFPRIGGKINGSISKNELFDNKGITTQADVSVIHFELHLIDGLGGKVFQEESNQLNNEMKAALKKINAGETIYFENIKGKTEQGDVVRLNPLRYVLMN